MTKAMVILVLLTFLAGCSMQSQEQRDSYSEPPEEVEETNTPYTGQLESPDPYEEYLAEQEQLQAEVVSISDETNLPLWSELSDRITYNGYTIEYQRELPGKSFVGYADYFDIIEKDSRIYMKADEWDACDALMYIEITEDQLQSILEADDFNGFVYAFTITKVCYYDIGIDAERVENEEDDYISIDGVPGYIIVYATCGEIYKFI